MLNRVTVCLASSLLLLVTPTTGYADQLSVREALTISSSQSGPGTTRLWGSLNIDPGQSGSTRLSEDRAAGERATGGVIGVGENFGIILDYSDDLPRVRGLAFSATDYMRVEARGQLDADLSDVGARVSVHFSF